MRRLDIKRRNRASSTVLLLLAGAIVLAVAGAPPASAGQYKVVGFCVQSRAGMVLEDEPITTNPPIVSQGFHIVDRCQPSGDGSILFVAEGPGFLGGKRWVIRAPAETTIRGIEYDLLPRTLGNTTGLEWRLVDASERPFEGVVAGSPPPGHVVHNEPQLDTTLLRGAFRCGVVSGCAGGPGLTASIEISHLTLTLEDELFPEFITPLTGSLVSDELLRGVEQVSFWGEDQGSGVAGAFLLVDGAAQPLAREPNGGSCREPYRVLVPCRMQVRSSLALDTRQLSEGFHVVEVVLLDAAGNETESEPLFVFVHNAPTNVESPVILGSAEVGSPLSVTNGTWLGDPTSFSYQWLRCPAQALRAVECAPIIGATGPSFTPQELDRKNRDLVMVTAVNASGSEATFSEATQVIDPDRTPPVLRNVKLSKKQFMLGSRRISLGFSSSEAGRLTVAVASSKRTLGVLRRNVKAGKGKIALDGLLRGRALRPGSYRLLVFATDGDGNASDPVRRPFKILIG